jgi:hypothetical protein
MQKDTVQSGVAGRDLCQIPMTLSPKSASECHVPGRRDQERAVWCAHVDDLFLRTWSREAGQTPVSTTSRLFCGPHCG